MQSRKIQLGVVGNTAVYCGPEHYEFLGRYRFYTYQLICGPNGLATPGTIAMQHEVSADGRNFSNRYGSAEISAGALSQAAQASLVPATADPGTAAPQKFGRLRLSTSAVDKTSFVEAFVTGRNA